jgi:hypothetical protein
MIETQVARPIAPPQPAAELRRALEHDVIGVLVAAIPITFSFLFWLQGATGRTSMLTLAVISATCGALGLWRCHAGLGRWTEIGALVFQIGMMFWFYIPCLATAFTERQWVGEAARIRITNREALTAFVLVNLFYFVFSLSYALWPTRRLVRPARLLLGAGAQIPERTLVVVLAVWFAVALGFYFVAGGGIREALSYALGSRTVAKPWGTRGNYGTALTPLHIVALSSMIIVSCYSLHLLLTTKLPAAHRATLILLAIFSTGWVSIDSGTRSIFIQATIPPLLLWYRRLTERQGPAKYLQYACLLVLVVSVAVGASLQREYRYPGQIRTADAARIDDNDFFRFTTLAVAVHEREGRLVKESVLLTIAAGPVPRVLWPSKPELRSLVVFSDYVWGVDITEVGGNTLPSIVGQYFITWGWLGVIEIALALALIMRLGDNCLSYGRGWFVTLSFGVIVVYLFVAFRSIGFSFFSPVLLILVSVWVIRAAGIRMAPTRL